MKYRVTLTIDVDDEWLATHVNPDYPDHDLTLIGNRAIDLLEVFEFTPDWAIDVKKSENPFDN